MQLHAPLRVLPVLLLAALGCATSSSAPASCPPGIDAVLASPTLLRERYEQAYRERNWDRAYRSLAMLHTYHPESPEDRELFNTAAGLFKGQYKRHRAKDPGSIWVVSEPVFMIQWMLQIFERQEEFPEEELVYLFRGMPLFYYQEFADYAKQRGILRRWDLQVHEDNGRVESITGTRIESSEKPASGAAP